MRHSVSKWVDDYNTGKGADGDELEWGIKPPPTFREHGGELYPTDRHIKKDDAEIYSRHPEYDFKCLHNDSVVDKILYHAQE
jgi:hypothetical protein